MIITESKRFLFWSMLIVAVYQPSTSCTFPNSWQMTAGDVVDIQNCCLFHHARFWTMRLMDNQYLLRGTNSGGRRGLVVFVVNYGASGLVVFALDYGARGPRFESRWGQRTIFKNNFIIQFSCQNVSKIKSWCRGMSTRPVNGNK